MLEWNALKTFYLVLSRQFRGFKTDRSIEAEQKRNPTMTTRLKSALQGTPQKTDGELNIQAEKLKKLLSKSEEQGNVNNAVYNSCLYLFLNPV